MPEPLLQTKLYIPPLRPNLVPRPRLIERFNQALQPGHKLTLVSAPAGFGKTTLLSEWANQSDTAVAWLSLDDGDNDPARFLAYLVAAIQTVDQSVGQGVLAALGSPQPPATEALLTTLINQISATADAPSVGGQPVQWSRSGRNFALVLDDYHLITAQPIHDALTFLLDHLPGNMHLIVATRSDPPLSLARLRGRGLLAELRESDLRFSHDETAQFINTAMDLELSADDLAALAARAEGWIAGLQMAAVSMQSRRRVDDSANDASHFIAAFSGSNRFILDYLVEEVLYSQPDPIRTFLLHTAVLDLLTAPLCAALLGGVGGEPGEKEQAIASAQDTLEYLERANLFIVPLDEERRWYRYHHLFADLLRNQLNKTHPGLQETLHGHASQWFEQESLIPEAIGHAIAAGDFDRAATLLESIVSSLLNESRPATLLSLMTRIPDDTIAAHPWLAVHGAWAFFLTWQFDAVESLLQSVESNLPPGPAGQQPQEFEANRIRVRSIALRAFMAQWQGDLAAATALSHQALQGLDEDDLQLRSVLETNLADISLIQGDLAPARRHVENSLAAGKQAGNYYSALSAVCRLAELDVIQGHLHQAANTFQGAVRHGLEWGGGQPMPGTGRAHVGLAQVLYEWNDLDGAQRHLTRGLRLGEECGAHDIVLPGYLMLARLRQARGEAEAATQALEQAAAIAPAELNILPAGHVSGWQTRISLAQGDVAAATRWAESLEIPLDASALSDQRFEESYLTLVRVRIAQGRVQDAMKILDRILPAAETAGRVGRVIEIQVLLALALQAVGDATKAMIALEQALALAEPQGYARTFLDEGLPMARLLYDAAERGTSPQYAGKLLGAFDAMDEMAPESKPLVTSPLIEPLSKRELQVLQLIAEGLTNQEIAGQLVLSLNTVKGHTRKIYGKLGVNSRTQAVAKAKALGSQFPG